MVILFVPLFIPATIFGKWDAIDKLKNNEVCDITLNPSSPGWKVNLTNSAVHISDKKQIDSLIHLLRKTGAYFVNHPIRIWETNMIIVTKGKDSLTIEVNKTSNNGTTINSEYRQDALGNYLEKITNYTVPQFANRK